MLPVRVESLDGCHLGAGDGNDRREARARGASADMHGAGAAHADSAAELGAGQTDRVADHPEERRVVLDIPRHGSAVDLECGHIGSQTLLLAWQSYLLPQRGNLRVEVGPG